MVARVYSGQVPPSCVSTEASPVTVRVRQGATSVLEVHTVVVLVAIPEEAVAHMTAEEMREAQTAPLAQQQQYQCYN